MTSPPARNRRHLSSLQRGLAALGILNQQPRISAAELALRIDVPRTSAHRILHTLVVAGYVLHDPHSRRYSLSAKVLDLAQNLGDESELAAVARPILRDLCKTVLNPVGLATLVGQSVVIQVSLDYEAPLALRQLPEGTAFPVVCPPSGHLFLAYANEGLRHALIQAAATGSRASRQYAYPVPSDVDLSTVRAQGYAMVVDHDKASPECVLAVPVVVDEVLTATVHLRFPRRSYTAQQAVAAYLGPMRAAAAAIAERLRAPKPSFTGRPTR